MEPRVVIVEGWPQPDTVEPAFAFMAASKLVVGYGTGDGEFAVLSFHGARALEFGGPNDEALNGHPLYRYGLKHYSIHRIDNSPWLSELERQNAVHPQHRPDAFLKGKVHYLFALKEETLEFVVREGPGGSCEVRVFNSRLSAVEHLRGTIDV